MIYIGLDDTDVIDSPGTNQLAFAVARLIAPRYHVVRIVRHQLLEDPRVPFTSRNGSASMVIEPREVELSNTLASRGCKPPGSKPVNGILSNDLGTQTSLIPTFSQRERGSISEPSLSGRGQGEEETLDLNFLVEELIAQLCPVIVDWSPIGSDPGLCVTAHVPPSIVAHGQRCKRELVPQREAREAAVQEGIRLLGLGGTEDGVIGALAAVGLTVTENDGRVIYLGSVQQDISSIGGPWQIADLGRYGIDDVLDYETRQPVCTGVVDLGKKLRPNLLDRRVVLFVEPERMVQQGENGAEYFVPSGRENHWQAVKVR